MYNMINGVNNATFFILPMLGEKHPDEYPRFRDCVVIMNDEKVPEIYIVTRVGGNNRNSGYGEEVLKKHPNYLRDFDDSFDNTYAMYIFSVPEEWKSDFDLIVNDKVKEVSKKYKTRLYNTFPKLEKTFNKLFK